MGNDSELVLGIVQTVGTNSRNVIDCICDSLKKFKYTAYVIKVSETIISQFVDAPEFSSEYKRIDYFMDQGNRIRQQTGDDAILMKGVAAYIFHYYRHDEAKRLSRTAYIIDSIKHPDEVEFLRRTYGDGFHLIGITASEAIRKQYLIDRKHLNEEEVSHLFERDNGEKESNGQHTRDVYQQADYFLDVGCTQSEKDGNIYRLLDLLFGRSSLTPIFDEYAMFRAYVASLRSADLSRQIGAVVADDDTCEIFAEGTNDCPQTFGGLYWPICTDGKYEDIKGGRDYTLGYDSNKHEQNKIIDNILSNLGIAVTDDNKKKIRAAGIGSLTEYGRVVHGEMEALLMCARNGIPTRGRSMYMTTFPCHNCAKHIIAAGIKRVVYIEPYPKSKALEFYKNEISQDSSETGKKVIFQPFVGVGPHKFVDLFSMQSIRWYKRTRKDSEGNALKWDPEAASLRNPMAQFSYLDMETSAYAQYLDEIKGMEGMKGEG